MSVLVLMVNDYYLSLLFCHCHENRALICMDEHYAYVWTNATPLSFPRRRESRPTSLWIPASAGMTVKAGVNMPHFHRMWWPPASGMLDCHENRALICMDEPYAYVWTNATPLSFPRRRESRPTSLWIPASAGMTVKAGVNMRHFHPTWCRWQAAYWITRSPGASS